MLRSLIKLQLIIAVFVLILGCSRQTDMGVDKYDEKKMDEAIIKARSTFDQFLAHFNHPQAGDSDFSIKVRIEDNNGIEHFWVTDLKLDSEPYSGKIDNDPEVVKRIKLGQRFSFNRDSISDWMYMNNGVMQGNYTLRVELESMPKEQAEEIKKKFGL